MVKNLSTMQGTRFNSWVRKILWRRKWQPTQVFLPGEFHGQRHLMGYMGSQTVEHDWVTNTAHIYLYIYSYICVCVCVWCVTHHHTLESRQPHSIRMQVSLIFNYKRQTYHRVLNHSYRQYSEVIKQVWGKRGQRTGFNS